MIKVSRWNSATINQHFLPYNFRPKTEWPVDEASLTTASRSEATGTPPIVSARSIEQFQLPPKAIFDSAMPRYPNVWFYVEASLAASYELAVELVRKQVGAAMRLRDIAGPFSNPEGCDADVRLEHLQPWEDPAHRARQHAHAFHMRYYYTALAARQLERVSLETPSGPRAFYRVAASAHYEVEHTNPNHADVEICPICGRTGEYQDLQGSLVELVHDPLGLELLFDGTIRGEVVRFEDAEQAEVGGITALRRNFALQPFTFPAQSGDRNTLRIGVLVIAPPALDQSARPTR